MSMLWTTQQREVIENWAAGPIVQNLDRRYSLDAVDKAYLAGLGVNADERKRGSPSQKDKASS